MLEKSKLRQAIPAEAISREGARILAEMIFHMDLKSQNGRSVTIEIMASAELFDRLCVWGAAFENDEIDEELDCADSEEESGV